MPDKPHPRGAFALLAAAAFLTASCGKNDGAAMAKSQAAAAPPPLEVSAIRVSARRIPVSLEAVGQAEGSREVEIRSRVSGIIEKRLYEEGAAVGAGTVLFRIDAAPYELAVQQARAALVQ